VIARSRIALATDLTGFHIKSSDIEPLGAAKTLARSDLSTIYETRRISDNRRLVRKRVLKSDLCETWFQRAVTIGAMVKHVTILALLAF
jgi:hypothetical protein